MAEKRDSQDLVPIDWDALETAVERNSSDTESYLERSTGQVLTITSGEPEAPSLRAKVRGNIANYLRVEPASSREQYRWMERFVASVSDDALRKRLGIAIDGKGAFRRFKDVLLAFPAERERWFSYRSNLLHWHISGWLESHEVKHSGTPPWGDVTQPPELETVGEANPIAHSAPGEALRRQARDLIDAIAPIDLPSAIAFLEFLKERGSSSLAPDEEEEKSAPAAVPSIVR
jgi:hypothetical protein